MTKKMEPTKYQRVNILDPRNTNDEKIWTYQKATRKNLGPTKYTRDNLLDPRNNHENTIV